MDKISPKGYAEEEKEEHKPLCSSEWSHKLTLAILSEIVEEKSDDRIEGDKSDRDNSWGDMFSYFLFEEKEERDNKSEGSFEEECKKVCVDPWLVINGGIGVRKDLWPSRRREDAIQFLIEKIAVATKDDTDRYDHEDEVKDDKKLFSR